MNKKGNLWHVWPRTTVRIYLIDKSFTFLLCVLIVGMFTIVSVPRKNDKEDDVW